MAEYIEREAALRANCYFCSAHLKDDSPCDEKCADYMKFMEIPAADVRPVVRAKWKRVVDFTGVEAFGFKETMVVGWGCSVCGYEADVSEESFNFCPNCGADMKGENDG